MNSSILHATVEAVRYPKSTEQLAFPCFIVLGVRSEQGESFIAKGEMPYLPSCGTRLNLSGVWSAWNGQKQFKFFNVSEDLPVDERGMLRYACQLTDGFGPVAEERIWGLKGDGWRELEAGEVAGINEAKLAKFRETIRHLAMEAEKSSAIVWLTGVGCTMRMAEAAWEKWKLDTVGTVQTDCYRLAWLDGVSFNDVDTHIRRGFNIGDCDERRLDAAIRYCVELLLGGGDNLLSWKMLQEELAKKLPNVPMSAIVKRVAAMFGKKELVAFGGEMLARWTDYEDEKEIWNYVRR